MNQRGVLTRTLLFLYFREKIRVFYENKNIFKGGFIMITRSILEWTDKKKNEVINNPESDLNDCAKNDYYTIFYGAVAP